MSEKVGVLSLGARGPYGLDALQTSLVWRSGKLTPAHEVQARRAVHV